MSFFQRFVRFNNDLFGLDRTLRLIQAVCMVLTFYPNIIKNGHQLLFWSEPTLGPKQLYDIMNILSALAIDLDRARRWMRTFCFLLEFHGGITLSWYTWKMQSGSGKTANWFDATAALFNSMYLFTELLAFPDELELGGLRVWDPKTKERLDLDAMRFWFLALACSALASYVRLRAERAKKIPTIFAPAVQPTTVAGKKTTPQQKDPRASERELRERQRQAVRGLQRQILASLLDMVIPAAFIGRARLGWVRLDRGIVELATVGSTVLTGMDVWNRKAREIAAGPA